METNMIVIIVLLSLLGCAIIGVGIYFIVIFTKKDDGRHKKCLNGCKFRGVSGNCGKPPCKRGQCPYTCADLRIGEKGWCQYDKYMGGNPKVDCTGCGCK
jgi:hypothetical protein